MSKFLDQLEKVTRGTPASMGFGVAGRNEKAPSMALIGLLSRRHAEGAKLLGRVGVEGVLIEGVEKESELKRLQRSLGQVPWGISATQLGEEAARTYLDQGCDFFAFSPDGATVSATSDDDVGYLLRIQADLDERWLRAIEDLPIDAVILSLGPVDSALNFQHLMTVSSIRCMFSKYLLVQIPETLTGHELKALRDIGVDGIIVEVSGNSEKVLKELKENLLNLPRQRKPRSSKPDAMLPHSVYRPTSMPLQGDDEDGEDEEDEE